MSDPVLPIAPDPMQAVLEADGAHEHRWEDDLDRADRAREKSWLVSSSPMSRMGDATACLLGPGAGPSSHLAVDVAALVAAGWLPASKLKEQ